MENIENIIKEILLNPNLYGCIVEYYPHIIKLYDMGGQIKTENLSTFTISNYSIMSDTITEYIHREKKMIVHESDNNQLCCDREYLNIQQKHNMLTTEGLFIVSRIEHIDPNKFPILNKYYDITKKKIKTFRNKYISVSIINETEHFDEQYIKLSFGVNNNEQYINSVLRHVKGVIALLQ